MKRLFCFVGGFGWLLFGWGCFVIVFVYGIVCYLLFGVVVIVMIVVMFFGMSRSFGIVLYLWFFFVNGFLII